MNVDEIRDRISNQEYEISHHAEKERYNEDISIEDIERVIMNGEILENYPDDKRGPSCLVLGYSNTRPVHIVCGRSRNNWLRIITVYLPKKPRWVDERIRYKGEKYGT